MEAEDNEVNWLLSDGLFICSENSVDYKSLFPFFFERGHISESPKSLLFCELKGSLLIYLVLQQGINAGVFF